MNCHEARQKITESDQARFDPNRDKELLEHIRSCNKCAELVQAEMSLRRDFDANKGENSEGGLSFQYLKTRVECIVDSGSKQRYEEIGFMDKLINKVTKRPRLGLSLGLFVILLAFVTLVPFKFEQTLGYEVAIAGVDKDLALDNDKVQMLFVKLGLDDAKFDVSDCEAVCNMTISELRSEEDVQIVVAAFDEIGNCTLEEVSEVFDNHSAPLIWMIKDDDDPQHCNDISKTDILLKEIDGETRIFVSGQLSELHEATGDSFSVWVSDCNVELGEGSDNQVSIISLSLGAELDCDSIKESFNDLIIAGPNDFSTAIHLNKDHKVSVGDQSDNPNLSFISGADGKRKFSFVSTDGNVHLIDLDDEDSVEKLRELGIVIDLVESMSGEDRKGYFIGDGKTYDEENNEIVEESISSSATKFSNNLPGSYELQQNYPNPFNPTTAIIYSLPKAEFVTLEIYNTSGQKVRTLVDEVSSAGEHAVMWDATNDNNNKVATGVYLYKITAGDFTDSKKMSLVK